MLLKKKIAIAIDTESSICLGVFVKIIVATFVIGVRS